MGVPGASLGSECQWRAVVRAFICGGARNCARFEQHEVEKRYVALVRGRQRKQLSSIMRCALTTATCRSRRLPKYADWNSWDATRGSKRARAADVCTKFVGI